MGVDTRRQRLPRYCLPHTYLMEISLEMRQNNNKQNRKAAQTHLEAIQMAVFWKTLEGKTKGMVNKKLQI